MIEERTADTPQRHWYRCAGLSLVSALDLSPLAEGAAPGRPDVVIEPLPAALADDFAAQTTYISSVGEEGSPWLEVRRGPGGYLARWTGQVDIVVPDDGRRILVCERGEVRDSLPRLLLCQAMSFVLPGHGREGLHASAVEIDGRAIVIAGESGRGKSTLATALCARGARLIADDITSIRLGEDGRVVVDATATKTWLAREVAGRLVGTEGLELGRDHKVALDGFERAGDGLPLGAIFHIGMREGEPLLSDPIPWKESLAAFLGALFNYIVRTPDRMASQFDIATLIAKTVPARILRWEPGPIAAAGAADLVLRALGGAPQGDDPMTERPTLDASEEPAFASENGKDPAANGAAGQRRQIIERLRAAGLHDLPDENFDEPLLRTSQVAALLRSSDRTIRTWADAGKLPYIKTLGGRRLFPASAVLEILHTMRAHREEAK